jgi:hypothetical protein
MHLQALSAVRRALYSIRPYGSTPACGLGHQPSEFGHSVWLEIAVTALFAMTGTPAIYCVDERFSNGNQAPTR